MLCGTHFFLENLQYMDVCVQMWSHDHYFVEFKQEFAYLSSSCQRSIDLHISAYILKMAKMIFHLVRDQTLYSRKFGPNRTWFPSLTSATVDFLSPRLHYIP